LEGDFRTLLDLLPQNLLFDAKDEMLQGTRDKVVRVKELVSGIDKLVVVF
jgi:hypothetical protein